MGIRLEIRERPNVNYIQDVSTKDAAQASNGLIGPIHEKARVEVDSF